MSTFGKNENYGLPAILKICLTPWSARRQILLVELVERSQGVVRRPVAGLVRFVKHHRDAKILLCRQALDQRVAFVQERLPVPVPVNDKSGNPQLLRFPDLFSDYDRVLGGIAHLD